MVLGICQLFKASSSLCVSESCIVRECYKSYIAPVGWWLCLCRFNSADSLFKKKKLRGCTIIRSLVILCLCDWRPASRQLLSNSMHLIHTDECCIYPAMQESTTNRNIYSDVANKKHADHIHICRLQCSHLHLCIDVCRDIQNYHIHQLQTSMDKILALPELPTMCTVYSNFCWVCLSSFWIKAFFSSSGSALNMKTDLSPMSSLTMRNRMKLSDLIEEAKL